MVPPYLERTNKNKTKKDENNVSSSEVFCLNFLADTPFNHILYFPEFVLVDQSLMTIRIDKMRFRDYVIVMPL